MKVVALGRTEILLKSILKVKEGGHQVPLIITCEAAPGYKVFPRDFEKLAREIGADFRQTEKINSPEVIELIRGKNPDIGISVNWQTIIGQKVIDCFPGGIINAHAGDLPRYRGNAVPNWAIINGEDRVVLTLHLMALELDAGPIILQREMPLTDNTYIAEVYRFMEDNFPEMFLEAVNKFADKSFTLREQPANPALSLRCYPRTPVDGEIDWTLPAFKLARLVRAASEPFVGAYTFIGAEKLIVWRAHSEIPPFPFCGTPGQVAERRLETGEVAVVTGEGFLVLEEIETEGEGRRKAAEIIKTIRTRLGMDVSGELSKLNKEIEQIKKTLTK